MFTAINKLWSTLHQIKQGRASQDEGGSLYLRVKLKPSVAMIGAASSTSGRSIHKSIAISALARLAIARGSKTNIACPPRKPPPKVSRNEPVCLPVLPTK